MLRKTSFQTTLYARVCKVSLQVQCRRGGVPRRFVSNHVLHKRYSDCTLPKTHISRKVRLDVSSNKGGLDYTLPNTEINRKMCLGVPSKKKGSDCTLGKPEVSRKVRLCVSSKKKGLDCTLPKNEICRKVHLGGLCQEEGSQIARCSKPKLVAQCALVQRVRVQIVRCTKPKLLQSAPWCLVTARDLSRNRRVNDVCAMRR